MTSEKLLKEFGKINNTVKQTSTVREDLIKVFKEYPNTSFTQGNFSKVMNKRTQHINQVLKGLLEDGIIVRQGSRKQYYYKLK